MAPSREPQIYSMAFPTKGDPRKFLVEGCRGQEAMQTAMRVHFLHRHVRDTVIILEEGNLPHPRCPMCDIIVPWKSLNRRHITTIQCTKGGGE